jgi:3-oxo-5alpha-steroid 4-dehydrogenase
MDRMSAWRFLYPPESLIEGIVISPSGERIAAEDTYGASFTTEMIQKADGHGFLILDSTQWNKFRSEISEQTQGLWRVLVTHISLWNHRRATTLEGLVKKLGIDPARTKATVEAYNDAINNGKPDPVGKREYRSVIKASPLYAVDISIQSTGIMMVPSLTLGGLKVDGATGLVLNEAGDTITGLYAAGRNAVGVPSANYVSGLSLADCVFSGRRAGKHAAHS